MGNGFLSRSSQGVKLASYLYVVLRLRISGTVPLLPLHALMVWTGNTTFYVYLHFLYNKNSVALVRERTIPTERPPLVGEVSANFCG